VRTSCNRFAAYLLAVILAAAPQGFSPTPDVHRALASISGDSLRGNLSFLASSLLEGRDTPSRGLDIAAEYIAAQFRRAGLEPAGDDGYFQTAHMLRATPAPEGFELRLSVGSRTVPVSKDQVTVVSGRPLALSGVPVVRIDDAAKLRDVSVTGKAVVLDAGREGAESPAKTAALPPAVFLQTEDELNRPVVRRLIDPDEERARYGGVPRLIVRDPDAVKILQDAKAGDTGIAVSIKLPAANTASVTVRNVAGLMRGSDPALRDQYILLTAHYDHLGRQDGGAVYPGANDDGSGSVSVIEIGQALAALPVHPKRSILFMTFFGEEEGSLGARYYTDHPLVPLSKTVADLNLEQLGRTDSKAGTEISNATLTGFQYSSVAHTLQEAGALTGVKVYETPGGDDYFNRSDNLPFAECGIPAHTLVVAFEFSDYHETGDVWQKIDYGNMAKVDRMIALGLVMLADSPAAPQWNKDNPNVAPYLRAR